MYVVCLLIVPSLQAHRFHAPFCEVGGFFHYILDSLARWLDGARERTLAEA